MPLQATGTISLNDLQNAYGGANPIGLNEYYRGGGLVATGTGLSTSIPTSGAISFSNFYGQLVPTTGAYALTTNASGSTGVVSGKGYVYDIYYRGFKSSGELFYPGSTASPANNNFGSVSGNAYTTPGGSFNVVGMYSVQQVYNNTQGFDNWLVMEVRRTGSHLPLDDGFFTKFTFPIIGDVGLNIPTSWTVSRSNATQVTQYTQGAITVYYHTRYVWYINTGTSQSSNAFRINGGSNYSLTYYA